jgi:hypothetical protein
MSDTTPEDAAPDQPSGESDLSAEEYGSLTVEDDPDGTVDPADLANTADESDHDLPDSGTQPNEGSPAS